MTVSETMKMRQGAEALGEGAIRAGVRHFFGYPHAPQTDLVTYLARRLPEVSGVFVQAESVRSSLSMALGATGGGARVLASVAGSDFGLAGETLSYLVAMELPMVLTWFTRSGPGSGGMAPSQEGFLQASSAAGGFPVPVWAPMNAQEMHDLTLAAFELADQHRHPVVLMADSLVAQAVEPVVTPTGPVGLHHLPAKPWAVSGQRSRPRNVLHSRRQPDGPLVAEARLLDKVRALEAAARQFEAPDEAPEILIVATGGAARVAQAGIRLARAQGIDCALFRPISLWPFPDAEFGLAASKGRVLVVEYGHGQLTSLLRACGLSIPVHHHGGVAAPPTAESVADAIRALAEGGHHD